MYDLSPLEADEPQEVEVVKIGPRLLAFVADGLVVVLFSVFLFEVFLTPTRENFIAYGPLILLSVWMIYRSAMETGWCRGQTIGRALQRIQVIRDDGDFLTVSESLLRNGLIALRVLFPFLAIADGLNFFREGRFFRPLQDRWTGSVVVELPGDEETVPKVRMVLVALALTVVFQCVKLYEVTPRSTPIETVEGFGSESFLEELKETALNGDPRSQLILGSAYLSGKELPQNYKEAAKWFELAANQGNAQGKYQLAVLYAAGKGVRKDFAFAVKLLRQAADAGDANARDVLQKLASVP